MLIELVFEWRGASGTKIKTRKDKTFLCFVIVLQFQEIIFLLDNI